MVQFDQDSLMAVFAMPDVDGRFSGAQLTHLRKLGQKRPVVFLAFPPKAAGTFFRTAICTATGGEMKRVVHALGGRDATPYLPTFLMYYCGGVCTGPLVAHAHMQALPANRNFLETFDIRPIIMLRSIPDMLASFWDMLDADERARIDGLNCQVPANYLHMSRAQKADFLVDIMGPWYASYFATWQTYVDQAPDKVCVLTYDEFSADPAAMMERALKHARLPKTRAVCQAAIDAVWAERTSYRYNKGTKGRGGQYFTREHQDRLARMLGYYPQLANRVELLLEMSGEAAPLQQTG